MPRWCTDGSPRYTPRKLARACPAFGTLAGKSRPTGRELSTSSITTITSITIITIYYC